MVNRYGDGPHYGCPMMIDGHGFDCRFCVDESTVFTLGETYEIPVVFLSPVLALQDSHLDKEISLWEGNVVAIGKILRVLSSSVIVLDGGEVDVFRTRDDACLKIEAIDVKNGEFRIFDISGNELEFFVTEREEKGFFSGSVTHELVHIRDPERKIDQSDFVFKTMAECLKRAGYELSRESELSLVELTAEFVNKIGFVK